MFACGDVEDPEQTEEAETTDDGHDTPTAIPFKRYAAIAGHALKQAAIATRGDPAITAVEERFKRQCVAEGLPYNSDITRRAVEAAVVSLAKAKQAFFATERRLRPMAARRGRP